MELTIKMHDTTFCIIRKNDDITLTELYEHFNAMLIGCTFSKQQIEDYITEKAIEIENKESIL